jgi:putative ABC transport system permease protein
MFRTTLGSLWSHKRRLISTCIAVILGVAFMTGTFVLSSTVNNVFDDLFGDLGQGVDAQVRGEELFTSQATGRNRARLDQGVVDEVAAVPGVAKAEGSIVTFTLTVLDRKGDPMGGVGPPTIVGTWPSDQKMASYQVAEGRAPKAAKEAIIDRAAAEDGPFKVGQKITLITPKGREQLTLVGISRFGDADSAGGSIFIGTTLSESQRLAGEPGKLDTVSARAEEGVTPEELVRSIEAAKVAPKADVVTGKAAAEEQSNDVKSGFAFFTTLLLVFAFIALFVGWFIISNTFSILVSQRTRELALLRALGATRRQVLGSVFLEAGIIGLFSSLLGLVAGIGLALGALAALAAFGIDLPNAGLVVEPATAVKAITAGMLITAIAAIGPAVRATRVAPIAALRETAIDTSGSSKLRAGLGILIGIVGVLAVLPAFGSEPTSDQIPRVGLGLALVIVSVLVLGPVMARPLARVVGSWLPRLKGITGRIARENAMRSPRRTASTASALIIGVTLVAFISIFASSAQSSVSKAIGTGFKGDYVVVPVNNFSFSGAPASLRDDVAKVDGVDVVTPISIVVGQGRLPDGSKPEIFAGGIDPATFEQLFDIQMDAGTISELDDDEIVVDAAVAKQEGLKIGDVVKIVGQAGRTKTFELSGISDSPALLGQWTLTQKGAAALVAEPTDFQLGIRLDKGVDPESVRSDLRKAVEPFPTMKVQDREQYTNGIVKSISALLNVIIGLLLVSIVIALIGIGNTLSLSIHERTRELGLLRATGMTRSQLRSSVRWEAVIVALMGTAIGIALGIGLSYVMVKVLASQGITEFQVPAKWMIAIVLGGAGMGILASVWPSYKASKLNVLDAIAHD